MSAVLVLLLAMQASGAGPAPLRKSDLVRLLSGSVMAPAELRQLVRRNCLTFDPTDRDRHDFRLLGADAALLAAVDDCLPPPSSIASATRSGFLAGGGQRGSAGAQLPRALVFEARDSAGTPLSRQAVAFTGINARIEPAAALTDAAGQARVGVTLGERAGLATVIASIGVIEKQVAFNVAAGAAAQLVVLCGQANVATRFAIRPDSSVTLRVSAQDGFANATALLALRAAVADARIFRVVRVAQDSVSGVVVLKPDQPGTTSLAVIANGMRQYLTVTVPPRAAPGKTDCP